MKAHGTPLWTDAKVEQAEAPARERINVRQRKNKENPHKARDEEAKQVRIREEGSVRPP